MRIFPWLLIALTLLPAAAAVAGETSGRTADATFLLKEVDITVHDDGRVDRRVHTVMRLHSLYAVNRLGDPRIEYDLAHQELSVLAARTVTADGRTLDAPAYAMNRSTPDAVAKCPDFADIGELVVTFVGLEKESVTELEYVVRDKTPWQSHGEIEFYFGDRFPVDESRLKVRVPARSSLHKWARALGSVISEAGPVHMQSTTTYEWTTAKLPGFPHRGWDKPLRVPGIVVSTAPHWAGLLEPLVTSVTSLKRVPHWDALMEHLQPADKPAASHTALLAQLVKGFKASFRIVRLGPGAQPLSARPLPRVAESRCATPLEAALLLAAALRDAGLKPTVLLATSALPQAESAPPPAGVLVRDAYVAVDVDGVQVFIDAATFALSGEIHNGHRKWLAGFSPGARHFVTSGEKLLKRTGRSVKVHAKAVLEAEGLKISGTLDTTGGACLWYEFPSGLENEAGAALVKAAFGPGLTVDKVVVSSAFPGRFSAQFEAHLPIARFPAEQLVSLKAGPLADRVEKTLADWLTLTADEPGSAGPIEYAWTLSYEGEEESFVPGVAEGDFAGGGASYRVRNKAGVTVTRRFLLAERTGPLGDDAWAVAMRFVADNGRDNIFVVKPVGD